MDSGECAMKINIEETEAVPDLEVATEETTVAQNCEHSENADDKSSSECAMRGENDDSEALAEPPFVPIKVEPVLAAISEEFTMKENFEVTEKPEDMDSGEYAMKSNTEETTLMEPLFVAIKDEPDFEATSEETTMEENFEDTESAGITHETVAPQSYGIASCSSADVTMGQEEAPVLLKGHCKQKVKRQKQKKHSGQCGGRSSVNHEDNRSQRETFQPGSSRSSASGWSFKCNECGKTFKRKDALKRHIHSYSGERPHKCSQCGKSFTDRRALSRHMIVHTEDRPYECSQCGKYFKELVTLTNHMRLHSGDRPYLCSQCGESFTHCSTLSRHMRQHTEDLPYKCSQCAMSFAHNHKLTKHMRLHKEDRLFKCSQCDQSFSRSHNLNRHMLVHSGDRPYKCSLCEQSFAQTGNLNSHMRTHSGERPYKCNQCESAFTRRGALTKHMQTHSP